MHLPVLRAALGRDDISDDISDEPTLLIREIWGGCGEMWGDMGRCGEMWGDMGRYSGDIAELWGDIVEM